MSEDGVFLKRKLVCTIQKGVLLPKVVMAVVRLICKGDCDVVEFEFNNEQYAIGSADMMELVERCKVEK